MCISLGLHKSGPKLIHYDALLHSLASDSNSVHFFWIFTEHVEGVILRKGRGLNAYALHALMHIENLASGSPFGQRPFRVPSTVLHLLPARQSLEAPCTLAQNCPPGAEGNLTPGQSSTPTYDPGSYLVFILSALFPQFQFFLFMCRS